MDLYRALKHPGVSSFWCSISFVYSSLILYHIDQDTTTKQPIEETSILYLISDPVELIMHNCTCSIYKGICVLQMFSMSNYLF
jgi:hypothetical protein